MSHIKKGLNILAGFLSLLAGAIVSVTVAGVIGTQIPSIVAAAAAFLSAVVTLIATISFDDKDIITTFQASSKFLQLHERACQAVVTDKVTQEERKEILWRLQKEYSELDELFSKYYPSNFPIRQMTKDDAEVIRWFEGVKALQREKEG